jgi:hypothetical protein
MSLPKFDCGTLLLVPASSLLLLLLLLFVDVAMYQIPLSRLLFQLYHTHSEKQDTRDTTTKLKPTVEQLSFW